jgi:hypothetical protein
MSANHNQQRKQQAAPQPPLPPSGFTIQGHVQRVGAESQLWWTKAREDATGEQGILVFSAERYDFFEAEGLLCMMAFLLKAAVPALIEQCSPEFLRDYAREVALVRTAAECVMVPQREAGERGQE